MKTLKPYCFILLALCLTLLPGYSCKKGGNLDADGLPKATQTGAIMFACKVNGMNWIPIKKMDIDGGFYDNVIRIRGSVFSSNSFEGRIDIEINNPGNNTAFRLNDINERFVSFTTSKNCFNVTGGYGVGQSKSTDGEVVFTKIDVEKKIISGTFWCDIPTDKCGTLKITHGRFDIRYY